MLRNINSKGHNSKYNNTVGTYHVHNREKYIGQYDPIYKSKLEAKMMYYLDHNENIVKWNYEAFPIKYIDESSKNKIRNYYIDFIAVVKSNDKLQTVWIEVKSESETKAPGRKASKNQKAVDTWIKNQSKWKAAKQLAESRGYKFVVISEKELENG